MSDAAVAARTGKTWKEWFGILDKAGAGKMSHQEIVAHLDHRHDLGPWWRQMVTVTYEQVRGMRDRHEKPNGYQISRSRTIGVPLSKLYRAWSDAKTRALWLSDPDFTVRKATRDKSMRVTWTDGITRLEVNFIPKGTAKSQVAVQHDKLSSATAGERMKRYWTRQLDRLESMLTG